MWSKALVFKEATMWSNEKNCMLTRVTVLGCSGVGKTALVVRYLTKRYIGDYISGTDITYKCELSFVRRQIEVQIVDTSGDASKDNVLDIAKRRRSEADVLMLVYAVNDASSFHFIQEVLPELSQVAPKASILVVGNKSDIEQSSMFFDEELRKLSEIYTFSHMRASAKSSFGEAAWIFSKSISLVIKKRTLETSASSSDLTAYDAESRRHEFKLSVGSRCRRSGRTGAKLPRRATVDCGLGMAKTVERRLSDRLPSVEDAIQEETEDKCGSDDSFPRENPVQNPHSKSFAYRKRRKVPPVSINLVHGSNSDGSLPTAKPQIPKSAPLPANAMPIFKFPEVSCAAEYRHTSLPTSPNTCMLKRQNSFLNKLKGALTAVPQRLRSPK